MCISRSRTARAQVALRDVAQPGSTARLATGKWPEDRGPRAGVLLRATRRIPAQYRGDSPGWPGRSLRTFPQAQGPLEAEGLFAAEAKRPLPEFPRHIAIVSSLQAAALRDVLTTLRRRAPHLRISIFPTLVQGEGAAGPDCRSPRTAPAPAAATPPSCCRGGGSIEDLWSFNEECVARAIRASVDPRDFRHRPRNRLHHCRLRRRPACPDSHGSG